MANEHEKLMAKSIEELTAMQQACKAERMAAKDRGVAIGAIIELKQEESKATEKFERMSPSERKVMAQLLSIHGIASNGAVGTPGH